MQKQPLSGEPALTQNEKAIFTKEIQLKELEDELWLKRNTINLDTSTASEENMLISKNGDSLQYKL